MSTVDAKVCTAAEAVALIKDGDTIASEGFAIFLHAEELCAAIGRRYLETHGPRDLTLVFVAMHGLTDREGGIGHFAAQGLLKRVIGGYWGWFPEIGRLALNGDIEAYNLPQGVISQLFRDIAAKRPGCITHVGLDTFIDPTSDGGRLNGVSPADLVERITLQGRPWLWYKTFPVNIALLSASAADIYGNLLFDGQPILGESLAIAQAARNSGGKVLAQVGRIVREPAPPQQARVPGILVDRIVVGRPHEQGAAYRQHYRPAFCRPQASVERPDFALDPLPFCARKIIARRACREIRDNDIVNLGIGMPEEIAKVAVEEKLTDAFTLTVESGPIGGAPAGGLAFGAALHPQAIVEANAQFDFYDGNGLDFAALGAGQVDADGNVNVSKFGGRMAGVGGFVNISQTAKRLVFCFTFTADGLAIAADRQRLSIVKEGKIRKIVPRVEQISFNGKRAWQNGQEVLYVTERAVFRLAEHGLELTEIAPGIDLRKDVLSRLDFAPAIGRLSLMDAALFSVPPDGA